MEKSAPLLREVRGKRAEKGIWISFFLLLASGLVALYAASYYNAQDKGSSLSEVISQLMGVGVGAFLMAAVWKLNYRALSNPVISGAFVVVSLLLLGLVAIPGVLAFNMMNAKLRNIMSDMEGFSDELMGRIACEYQGRGV